MEDFAMNRCLALAFACVLLLPLPVEAQETAASPTATEPPELVPFNWGDFGWLDGSNNNPPPGTTVGPLTLEAMIDEYYAYSFNHPADHTAFPTISAPRNNEFNTNLVTLGVSVSGVKDVLGRLTLQAGNMTDTVNGADPSVNRGYFAGLSNLRYIRQAWVGYHLPINYGLNINVGVFPSFVGMESYEPQENWGYTHSLICDATPYYLQGMQIQYWPTNNLKGELWLFNGWQTFNKLGEAFGYGAAWQWRPLDRLVLNQNILVGNVDVDQTRVRYYADNWLQWKYADHPLRGIKALEFAGIFDLGYETASLTDANRPATWMSGFSLLHRVEFNDQWSLAACASMYNDPQQLIALQVPGVPLPDSGNLVAGEGHLTLAYTPVPRLTYKFEYRHDQSNIPYIAGPGGVSPPSLPAPAGWKPDFVTSGDRLIASAVLRF
jgi:hypothetical protein